MSALFEVGLFGKGEEKREVEEEGRAKSVAIIPARQVIRSRQ